MDMYYVSIRITISYVSTVTALHFITIMMERSDLLRRPLYFPFSVKQLNLDSNFNS